MTLPFLRSRQPVLRNARGLGNLSGWYDASDLSSMIVDGSNRVSLWADKSGNSSVNCLCLNAAAGNYASTPHSAFAATQLEIVARLRVPNWSNPGAGNVCIAAKDDGATARSFYFALTATTGVPVLYVGSTGAGADFASAAAGSPFPFSAYQAGWVKVTWNTTGSAVAWSYAADQDAEPTSWTQLGTGTITKASIYNGGTQRFEIGANATGTGSPLLGNVFKCYIRFSIGGANAKTFDASAQTKLATSWTAAGTGETWTVNTFGDFGARVSGERDLVQLTVANQPVTSLDSAGRRILTFDGTNDSMKSAIMNVPQPATAEIVAQQVTWTGGDRIFSAGVSSRNILYQVGVSPSLSIYDGAAVALASSPAVGVRFVVSAIFNSGASSVRNGRLPASAGNVGGVDPFGFVQIGDDGTSSFGNFTASEFALYSRGLSTVDQDRFAFYAGRKWGMLS